MNFVATACVWPSFFVHTASHTKRHSLFERCYAWHFRSVRCDIAHLDTRWWKWKMLRRHADNSHYIDELLAAVIWCGNDRRCFGMIEGAWRIILSCRWCGNRTHACSTLASRLLKTDRSVRCHWTYFKLKILRLKTPTGWPARFIRTSFQSIEFHDVLFVLWTLIASRKLLFIHAFKRRELLLLTQVRQDDGESCVFLYF